MLKDVRCALLAAFAFSAATNVPVLSTPLHTMQIFDTVVPLGSLETLVIITALTAMTIMAMLLLEIAGDMILLRASIWMDHEVGRQILENGLKLVRPEDTSGPACRSTLAQRLEIILRLRVS